MGTVGVDACGFKEDTPAPELRLRGGAEPLSAATSTNTSLFSLRFDPSFTFISRSSFGDELRGWIEDGEGNIVADKRVPRSDAIRVSFEPGELAEYEGSALRMRGRMQEGDSFGDSSSLQFGILRERATLPPGEQLGSPFGVVSTERLALDGRSIHMMHQCGIQWQRHHGLQFKNWKNEDEPPELDADPWVENWRKLKEEGFLIQAQQFSEPPPDWSADTSIYHREGKQILKDKPAMESNTIGRYTEHMGEELPEFTHFKLMNERDRDGRDEWCDKYAANAKEAYQGIKESYPEAVVAIEGGHNPTIVGKLLDRRLYDHLDEIDWHLYGGYFRVMSVPERLPAIRDRGYEQPIIATEFGVVPGSGALGVTPREAAVRLFQSVPTFLAAGGKRFCYFLWGAVGDREGFVDRNFHNVFMVGGEADEPQLVFFAYHALTRWLEGATPITGPTEKGSLRISSFERGEERIDCVWSAGEEAKFTWATSETIRYVDPIGRQTTARPRRGKVTIEVGFKPYLVISPIGTRLTF